MKSFEKAEWDLSLDRFLGDTASVVKNKLVHLLDSRYKTSEQYEIKVYKSVSDLTPLHVALLKIYLCNSDEIVKEYYNIFNHIISFIMRNTPLNKFLQIKDNRGNGVLQLLAFLMQHLVEHRKELENKLENSRIINAKLCRLSVIANILIFKQQIKLFLIPPKNSYSFNMKVFFSDNISILSFICGITLFYSYDINRFLNKYKEYHGFITCIRNPGGILC